MMMKKTVIVSFFFLTNYLLYAQDSAQTSLNMDYTTEMQN